MLKRFKWFFDGYKKSYFFSFILMLLAVGVELVPPLIIGETTDLIGAGQLNLRGLYILIGLFALSIVLNYVFTYGYSYLLFRGNDTIARESRRRLVRKLLKQSPIFYEKNTTGSLMGKATNDVRNLQDMAGFGMMSLVMTTIYPLIIVIVMSILVSFKMTLASVLPLVLIVIVTRLLSPRLYGAYRKTQEYFDRINDIVLENINGVRVIRAFNREESEEARFNKASENYYDANMVQTKYSALIPSLTKLVPGISYIIAFFLGAYLIARSQLTIGGLVSFISYLNLLVRPAQTFGEFINVFELASASIDRLWEIWSYKEDVVDKDDAVDYQAGGDIVFDDFDFDFSNGEKGLEDINVRIKHGNTLGVVGKVGSGKTTFLKQLLRLYPIEEEAIYLGGRPIEDYKIDSVREKIGYVPQEHILFSKSIKENISFGKAYSDEEIEKAISLADFKKDIEMMPDGLDTEVGERGVSLSGGQKQRLSIARALITNPEILILDDSLSAVDAKTEQNIIMNLTKERQGKTTLIAAHRLSGIMHADEIIVLDGGRIVERGSHEELVKLGGWYSSQFEAQKLEGGECNEF